MGADHHMEQVMQEPTYQELLSMVHQLDDYLRAIRSEELDGSEPALERLLGQSQALWTRAGAGGPPDTNTVATELCDQPTPTT